TRKIDSVQGVHLDVEKQDLRFLRAHGRQRGIAVAELADDAQVFLCLAILAQCAASGGFVIDDDDIHHVPSNVVEWILLGFGASRASGGDSRMAGMEISLI